MKTVLYLSLTLAACRLYAQDDPAWRHLPPDAAAIYHFNLATLTAKLPWEVLAAPIPAPQQNTSNREFVAILRDSGHAGTDLDHELFIIESGTSSGDSGKVISILFPMRDTARWTAFLRRQEPQMLLHALQGDTCYAGHQMMGAAWDSHYAVLSFVCGLPHKPVPGQTRRLAIRRSFAILYGYDDSTCIHDPLFRSGFADDADIHAWTKHGNLGQLLRPLLSPQPDSDTTPRTLTSLRFEKGRILVSSKTTLSPSPFINRQNMAAVWQWASHLLPAACTIPETVSSADATLTGFVDCKTLARCLPDQPLLSLLDKLTFTTGQTENTFELTFTNTQQNSLNTLYTLFQ